MTTYALTPLEPTARLAFMVVGPMVDVKLIALQAGTFGRRFAARFAPLTFACAAGVIRGFPTYGDYAPIDIGTSPCNASAAVAVLRK